MIRFIFRNNSLFSHIYEMSVFLSLSTVSINNSVLNVYNFIGIQRITIVVFDIIKLYFL